MRAEAVQTLAGLATATPAVPGAGPADPAAIRQAAEGFEALFLRQILEAGRAGLPGCDLTGGAGVTAAASMLDAELARSVARGAGLGIAEAVARQFSPASSPAAPTTGAIG
ncbi:rod-binding protein [Frigidibacter oleivorans]|uniref:rod-binding protein n=1 Tax=Frigidibacter oleivorans TaxID=2487129 RepID=UPI000F8DFC99|nr:rod-binding protein [Frigidibacter oleivorans]